MKKNYTMIDENNNVFTTTYKTARRFFELHGGNSVLIIDGISPSGQPSEGRFFM